MPAVEQELAHHGVGVVTVGLFEQQAVAHVVGVAQEGQLVFVAAGAFEFARVGVPHARLAQEVERDVGQRHVFLERGTFAAQLRELLRQDQRVVALA